MTTTSAAPKVSQSDSERFIRVFDAFEASAMSGEANVSRYAPAGRLDAEYLHLWRWMDHAYVVWSYATPIAWADETADGWTYTVPPDTYSMTTASKHLPHVFRAWDITKCKTPHKSHLPHDACPGRNVNTLHADYPHNAGMLYDCEACESGPCICGTSGPVGCVSRQCIVQ